MSGAVEGKAVERILFFTPFVSWWPHTFWEATLAFAAQLRGAEALFVNCGGLPDCDLVPRRTGRPSDVCARCRSVSVRVMEGLALAHAFASDRVEAGEREAIRAWARELPPAELRAATWNGMPLGEWVFAGTVGYCRRRDLDTRDPEVRRVYLDNLVSAAIAVTGVERIANEFLPTTAVLLNGSFSLHRPVLEALRARGVRVVTHERAMVDNAVTFHEGGPVWERARLDSFWSAWRAVPLAAQELRDAEAILAARRKGKNTGWFGFNPWPEDRAAAMAALGLPGDRPMALLCTSCDHEPSLVDLAPTVSQDAWMASAIEWFAARPEYVLVIRFHPSAAGDPAYATEVRPRLEAFRAGLPPNGFCVLPHEPVNTYALVDCATAGLVYASTIGLEMACAGLPVAHAGGGMYRGAGFTLEPDDPARPGAELELAMAMPRSREASRLAYRYLYRFFRTASVPIRQVRVPSESYTLAGFTFTSSDELLPGRDADLDRAAAFVLGRGPASPPPTAEERARTTADEDRFFAKMRVAALLDAVRARPGDPDRLREAAAGLDDLGLTEDARRLYAAALAADPTHAGALTGLRAA